MKGHANNALAELRKRMNNDHKRAQAEANAAVEKQRVFQEITKMQAHNIKAIEMRKKANNNAMAALAAIKKREEVKGAIKKREEVKGGKRRKHRTHRKRTHRKHRTRRNRRH